MPSTSPGDASKSPSPFLQVLPGAANACLQTVACFSFRQRRYVAYISGPRLNILSAPNVLAQCLTFDEDVVAVTAEANTGRLALAGKKDVFVVAPATEGWTNIKWAKALYLERGDPGDEARTLSWGIEDEVLVGGDRKLSLFSTAPSSPASAAASKAQGHLVEQRRSLWSKRLPSPVQCAAFSPNSTLIASCGAYDRLVKIWRRLSFEEGLFDYTYLPHPTTVTSLQWRPRLQITPGPGDDAMITRQDDDVEVLYTIAHDGVLRVWKTGAMHDLEILTLHTTIDLISAVPESPSTSFHDLADMSLGESVRYTCILPSDQFCAAVDIATGSGDVMIHSSEHLREVASKDPEVVISFDGRGRMSAWGLQSIGHKRRPGTPPTEPPDAVFHVAHAENLPVRVPQGVNATFQIWCEGKNVNLVGHGFDGNIRWWRGYLQDFFSLSFSGPAQLAEIAYWSGHSGERIYPVSASSAARSLLSTAASKETMLWTSTNAGVLEITSAYAASQAIIDAVTISREDSSQLCLLLEARPPRTSDSTVGVSLRDSAGYEWDKSAISDPDSDLRSWQVFAPAGYAVRLKRCVFLSTTAKGYSCIVDSFKKTMTSMVDFTLPEFDPSDPLHRFTAVLDPNDSGKFGVIGLAQSGTLVVYHLQAEASHTLHSTLVAVFRSGVKDASVLAANNQFAMVASHHREVVVVNLTDGFVEHRMQPDEETRQIMLSQNDPLVAIVSDFTIDVYVQGRIGYREERPPWILIKQISTAANGLKISAMAWLTDNTIALAAGSVLFVSSNTVDCEELDADLRGAVDVHTDSPEPVKLSTIAQELRTPIPLWHPTFIAHIVRSGQWSLAASLATRLLQKLKFWSEGEILPPLLNVPAPQLYGREDVHDEKALESDTVDELLEQLQEKKLPQISRADQRRLRIVLQAMLYCSEHVQGLDNLALRYLFSWRMEQLLVETDQAMDGLQPNGDSQKQQAAAPVMHWREVAFAFHSTSQQPLLDVLMGHYDNKITWDTARRLGLFAWLSDRMALDRLFESLAQTAYRSTSPPDPTNASLYFLALHKKQTLAGLWRIATWHKEQRATTNFLRRDFALSEHQTAAKKNAYALMGKRRFEYAAAFFLLADDGASAVSILAGQCGDAMLAIAVGRLFSGDTSSAIRRLLEDRLIPEAKQTNDRWLLNWSYSLLRETERAAYALIRPLDGVRSWRQDDPALLHLYRRLRKSDLEYEFDAVLRAARILRRMGLWLIALELVSKWEFKRSEPVKATFSTNSVSNGVPEQAKSMLDDFVDPPKRDPPASLLDEHAPVQDEKKLREAQAAELLKQIKAKKEGKAAAEKLKQQQPTQFKEPDANSLLDSFGF